MNEEWFCTQLENLKIKENRLNTLVEIRVRLNEALTLETILTNRLLSAPEIYDCLEDVTNGSGGLNNEEINVASDILTICMTNLSISESQNELPRLLERALRHTRPQVRALAINTILKELQKHPYAFRLSDELLNHVISALQEENTEVAVPALHILQTLNSDERLTESPIKDVLLVMLSMSDTIKCRVYELAVNMAKRSPATLEKVEFLLDRALSELDNDDVLLQVNILEILVSLAEQNHGLLYMEKRQVFELLSKRIETLEENVIDRLLIPGIMKFFGKIASVQPQKIITGYPHMIQCLFDCLHSGDISILPTAFDTLANIAKSQQGKLLLDQNYSPALKEIFEEYASHIRNLSSDMKNRLFNSLEVIFTIDGVVAPEISVILHKWFMYLAGGTNMQFLMDFYRNPFPDIKVACLSFIKAISVHPWGVNALKDTAGFVEYLLDRRIEFDKEAKYAKFELIQILADSGVFDVQTQLQLQRYINQGPYFIESIMDVAVEGNE